MAPADPRPRGGRTILRVPVLPAAGARWFAILLLAGALSLLGCSATQDDPGSASGGARFPDVTRVEISQADDGTYSLDVTMSSPYDSPERYADGWRVLGPGDTVLGTMELGHDHASEQPFTRTQAGLEIPDDVDEVEVEGHDTENGYGGGTAAATVPR